MAITLLQKGLYEDALNTLKQALTFLKNSPHTSPPCAEQRQQEVPGGHMASHSSNQPSHHSVDHSSGHEPWSLPRNYHFFGVVPTSCRGSRRQEEEDGGRNHGAQRNQGCPAPRPGDHQNMTRTEVELDRSTPACEESTTSFTSTMIYSKAFVFNHVFCQDYKADAAAMVLFNLGLTYHIQSATNGCWNGAGSTTSSHQNFNLEFAMRSYKLCMTTVAQHGSIHNALLAVALFTNMRQVHLLLSRQPEEMECLERLNHCLRDPAYTQSLEEEDLRFFRSYAICSQACRASEHNFAPAA
ncbi:hypothetical protein ACA910_007575 [Epithemia clementina (nom. ined.)]